MNNDNKTIYLCNKNISFLCIMSDENISSIEPLKVLSSLTNLTSLTL